MAVIAAILVICGIASLVLAALVGFQDAKRLSNLFFVGICLCFALWSFAILLFIETSSSYAAFVAAKGYYLAAGLFPALLLLFSLVYPSGIGVRRPSKFTLASVAFLGAIFGVSVILQHPFVINGVTVEAGKQIVSVHADTYLLYSTYFVALFVIAMAIAFYKFFTLKGSLRMQAGLYAIGIFLNSIPGFIANLYLPYFGIYEHVWIGPAMSVVFLGLTTYGILRHDMFSIRLAAVRSTAYVFTLATLLGGYYAIVTFITYLFPNNDALVSFSPLNIAITILFAITFQPLKKFFDKYTNKFFYRDYYNVDDFFAKFNQILASATDLYPLLRLVSREVEQTFKAEQVFFSIINPDDGKMFTVGTQHHGRLPLDDITTLRNYTDQENRIVISDLLDNDSPVRKLMISHRIAMAMPIAREENVFIGFLCIGEHKANRYTSRDVKTLRSIADELVIAIQNALSVQQIRDMNAHLEQRVDAATKELRLSNSQLQRLDEVKDEFISMASHQLRTPLTSIKGYLSMLIEGDMGEITKEQHKVLEEAFISSERMVRLIGDFLNVSRLQTGKFVIEKHPVDLAKLVQRELESLESNASARGQIFEYKAEKDIPTLQLDEGKIQQVIMNFADNALFYSKDNGKITVTLKKTDDGFVECTIKDRGIGVPEKEQPHLFNKFFRASNARRARPDGTGVGLFLAKKVILDHGGSMIFESKEGKGSTFGFRLPLPKS